MEFLFLEKYKKYSSLHLMVGSPTPDLIPGIRNISKSHLLSSKKSVNRSVDRSRTLGCPFQIFCIHIQSLYLSFRYSKLKVMQHYPILYNKNLTY